ncbi:MAG: hypothetical protein HY706_15300 [Candidatus Hydrogenedentes bacterium]|nr:hypothetical protein [Candidatus Hydrogenedentota bacterium]
MATLYVRQVPDRLYRKTCDIAMRQGRSLRAYIVTVLEGAVEAEKLRHVRGKALARIRRRRRRLPATAPDTVTILRRIRGRHA